MDVRTCSVRTILPEPKFLGCIDHQIFLPMVLRCPRESSAKNVLISIWHAKFKLSASPRATPLVRLKACLHGGGGPQMCGSPHLSCKRDHIKMRDYMDRRVTSPTWGPHLYVKRPFKKYSCYQVKTTEVR